MNRERLWAPWRMGFLTYPHPRACFLCLAKRSSADRVHQVVQRGATVFALLNRYPYANGHLLVAPYRHTGDLERLRASEGQELFQMTQMLIHRLRRLLHPQGFNVGFNLGKAAGAGLASHLHLHIVPRWNGDINFMPSLAATKVISQSLEALYTLLTDSTGKRPARLSHPPQHRVRRTT